MSRKFRPVDIAGRVTIVCTGGPDERHPRTHLGTFTRFATMPILRRPFRVDLPEPLGRGTQRIAYGGPVPEELAANRGGRPEITVGDRTYQALHCRRCGAVFGVGKPTYEDWPAEHLTIDIAVSEVPFIW